MFFTKYILLFTTFICADAFTPKVKPIVKSFRYEGDYPPLGYFDPLKFNTPAKDEPLSDIEENKIKFFREAEINHGRVAMMSFVGMVLIDLFQDKPAVSFLANMPWENQQPYWLSVAAFEFSRMSSGWKNPFVKGNKQFQLNEYHQPGNVFGVNPENISIDKYNKELANGRLAMFAALGYAAEELVTGVQIF